MATLFYSSSASKKSLLPIIVYKYLAPPFYRSFIGALYFVIRKSVVDFVHAVLMDRKLTIFNEQTMQYFIVESIHVVKNF